jgi:hypothetical protein
MNRKMKIEGCVLIHSEVGTDIQVGTHQLELGEDVVRSNNDKTITI